MFQRIEFGGSTGPSALESAPENPADEYGDSDGAGDLLARAVL